MSRDINDLEPEFALKVRELLRALAKEGVTMKPFFTIRSPQEQAKLWRQCRSRAQIDNEINRLRSAGGHYLANVLQDVGPQYGPYVRASRPGFSWHQWGLAIDCYWLLDGKAEWSTKKDGIHNGYYLYSNLAEGLGLTSGIHFNDAVHVQAPKAGSPVSAGMSIADVSEAMHKRWGGSNEPRSV